MLASLYSCPSSFITVFIYWLFAQLCNAVGCVLQDPVAILKAGGHNLCHLGPEIACNVDWSVFV